ncbi:MAG TPA: DUF6265 family protein [Vitreimonas sp.]|uniref:DUF6265 family protein n=1 Tax=Vitreimonas sp. TaxID=3069702 RepID=UPI002D3FAA38|nr:DUF6265 family protein [Vitreimonas sp.]HYD89033.1 DUF6265 family protein [Vitreimonas sp.]
MRTLLFLAALAFAPLAQAQSLDDLAWLKGCWRAGGEGPQITEVWSAPPMPAMVGYSYTVGEGETQGWEQMRIEMIDGAPHFVAMPNGAAPVRFRMRPTLDLLVGGEHGVGATFENAAHDFPQRVNYLRVGNRLTATISRLDGSDPIHFRYRRINCSGALRP